MRFLLIALLLAACGGSPCTAAGAHAFTAHLTQADTRGPCGALPASFPVTLTATVSGSATTWTVNEGGVDHAADFSSGFGAGCQGHIEWFDHSASPALVHTYALRDGVGDLSIAQLGVCSAYYSLR